MSEANGNGKMTRGRGGALTVSPRTQLNDLAQRINTEHQLAAGAYKKALEHAVRAGQLLLQAKRDMEHGQWLTWLEKNCDFSERLAQKYMRVAREIPKLVGNTPRVADLSFREALHLTSRSAQALGKLSHEGQALAIDAADCKDRLRILDVQRRAQKEAMIKRSLELPRPLVPSPLADQTTRKTKVFRKADERRWCLLFGPNRVGLRLKELLAEEKQNSAHENRRMHIDMLRRDAEEAEAKAEELLAEAKEDREWADEEEEQFGRDVRAAVEKKHGRAFPGCMTIDFQINDAELENRLEKLPRQELIDHLLNNCDQKTIEEVDRGYWGDLRDTLVMASEPAKGGWTRCGGYDGMGFSEEQLQDVMPDT